MSKKITCGYTVACPYTGEKQRIQITYLKVPILGTLEDSYRKDAFNCSLSHECTLREQDRYSRCPVYITLPDDPNQY